MGLSSVRQYLQLLSSMGALAGDFYLLLGRDFLPAPSDVLRDGDRGPRGQCYRNAALMSQGSASLVYCEGFALQPGLIPMHHAWCALPDGTALDPTWGQVPGTEYVGVALAPGYLAERLSRQDVYGLFAESVSADVIQLAPRDFLHPDFLPTDKDAREFQRVCRKALALHRVR